LQKGKKALKNNDLDFIFSSCPPFTNHVIGHILSKHFHVKLIADFRDEWTVAQDKRRFPTQAHWKIHRYLEQKVIGNAHMLTTVSGAIRDKYLRAYQGDFSNKWHVVTNGYDEDDFAGYYPEKGARFRVTYIGAFYGPRSPKCFLQAANDITRSDFIKDVELNFIGWSAPLVQSSVRKYVTKNISINISGHIDHSQVIREMAKSSVLLLVVGKGGGEATYPGKLFEYLRSAKPILALASKQGVSADLISRTRAGIVVDPEDVAQIKNALQKLYDNWKEGTLDMKPNWAEIKKYDRRALTKELVDIIESAW